MVDLFSLLVSLGMLAVVVFFAMRMDRELPWFVRPRASAKAQTARPGETAGIRATRRPSRFPGR